MPSTVSFVDWGDVPTWVSAVTTFGALIAAGWVVAIELGREKRVEMANRAAQADRVAAWPRFYTIAETKHDVSLNPADRAFSGWAAEVRNGSDLPVYDVVVAFWAGRQIVEENVGSVAPGSRRVKLPAEVAGDLPEPLEIGVRFRDAAGRSWSRDGRGHLRECH